jgi:hypothetical protein
MPEYDNNNTGVLFINDKRESERHPHMKGSATIDGKEYWVSAWSKTSPKVNGKFLSFSYTLKDKQPEYTPTRDEPRASRKPQVQHEPLDDDDIPF